MARCVVGVVPWVLVGMGDEYCRQACDSCLAATTKGTGRMSFPRKNVICEKDIFCGDVTDTRILVSGDDICAACIQAQSTRVSLGDFIQRQLGFCPSGDLKQTCVREEPFVQYISNCPGMNLDAHQSSKVTQKLALVPFREQTEPKCSLLYFLQGERERGRVVKQFL